MLECHVRGLPTPEVSWIRDGVKIDNSDKYHQIDHEDGTCELVINNPVTMDSGKYICRAENRAKKEEIVHVIEYETKVRVPVEFRPREAAPSVAEEIAIVEAVETKAEAPEVEAEPEAAEEEAKPPAGAKKPAEKRGKKGKAEPEGGRRRGDKPLPDAKTKLHFAAQLPARTVAAGTKLKLSCIVIGPEPQIKWLKNGGTMAYGPKIRNQTKEGNAAIEFLSITVEDSAEYTCVAKNVSGEVTTSAKVTVYQNAKEEVTKPIFTRNIIGMLCMFNYFTLNLASVSLSLC